MLGDNTAVSISALEMTHSTDLLKLLFNIYKVYEYIKYLFKIYEIIKNQALKHAADIFRLIWKGNVRTSLKYLSYLYHQLDSVEVT